MDASGTLVTRIRQLSSEIEELRADERRLEDEYAMNKSRQRHLAAAQEDFISEVARRESRARGIAQTQNSKIAQLMSEDLVNSLTGNSFSRALGGFDGASAQLRGTGVNLEMGIDRARGLILVKEEEKEDLERQLMMMEAGQ
jgi:outer membrane murein-binding lipoprotein Lpp